MTIATVTISLLDASERDALGEVPQLYRTDADQAATLHPLFARAIAACRSRWGRQDLIVQSQTVNTRSGLHPGIPVQQRIADNDLGEVAVACLGSEALLTQDATVRAGNELVFARCGTTWQFAAAANDGVVVVLLITPDDGRPRASQRRHCARVFAPPPQVATHPLPEWARARDLHFESGFELEAEVRAFTQDEIAAEPPFVAASTQELERHGGPIAHAYLDALPADWRDPDADVIVQVKRDELSPGWYPALINWHMDGTSRANRRSDGSVDLRNPGRKVEQLLLCVGPASPTGILLGELRLPEIPLGMAADASAGIWQRLLLDELAAGSIAATTVPERHLARFGWGGFHTATRSECAGWRLFIKAMRGRGDVPRNERPRRATVTWPLGSELPLPEDPCGVFPEVSG